MRAARSATFSNPGIRSAPISERTKISSLTKQWPTAFRMYVNAHCASFFMYATLGKGYAYVGFPPIYIGEVLLLGAVILGFSSQKLRQVIVTPIGLILIMFLLFQCIQTFPYLSTYGLLAIRDAMAWIYSLFGIAIAGLIVRLPWSTEYAIMRYKTFGAWFSLCGLLSAAMFNYFQPYLPVIPGTTVTIPFFKGGDFCVELAGVSAFALTGSFRTPVWWFVPVSLGVLAGGSVNRGGLLAFISSIVVISVLRRQFKMIGAISVSLLIIGLVLSLIVDGGEQNIASRVVSPLQVIQNLSSIGSNDVDDGLNSTKTWRLNWWTKIIDYTLYGQYFWTGKGYGINLAVDDGIDSFDASKASPLRSPHNSHLTFLARSGVPGFSLWCILQCSWLVTMLNRYGASRRACDDRLSGLFSWLIAYWLAFLINASFDVSLEGPMSAIPFWTIFGLGWGAAVVFYQPARLRAANVFHPMTSYYKRYPAQI